MSDTPVTLLSRFRQARAALEAAARPLSAEDMCVQSMPDASPAKWHLAHTSWFFETFVLADAALGKYQPFDSAFNYLFNSYYDAVGDRHPRAKRGLLTRPSTDEVLRYRAHVDSAMAERLLKMRNGDFVRLRSVIELGINHEQQHLELLLTDIKHAFAQNPLKPPYRARSLVVPPDQSNSRLVTSAFVPFDSGVYHIGHPGNCFAFDNEGPSHRVFLEPFAIASQLVTCGEYLTFMSEGGYERPDLWLSDGWATKRVNNWESPLYWERRDGGWHVFTLEGTRSLDEWEPVCHLSFYEADAYARWAGCRLPTEAEWEVACSDRLVAGNLLEEGGLHPAALATSEPLNQMFGDVWEWTQSPYGAYPGYSPPAGALGEYNGKMSSDISPSRQAFLDKALAEYNGKFMVNQMVLRGGSCVTPRSHIRKTYRNFFPPDARWQFSGIRLAKDVRE